ncbi:MAG: hypothetical protein E7359_03525 [Clostridiales bacterium]|nr:hypothetical protein [Clostridiales bacterium]
MIVYIEQILIDNFIINFFILLSLQSIFKVKLKKLNLVLSSLLGSIVAVILPIFNFSFIFSSIIKILLSLTMVAIIKKYKKIKEFFLYYLSFLFLTFMFGGACIFLLMLFDSSFNVNNYYSYNLPIGAIVLIIFFLFVILKNIFKNIYSRKTVNNFVFKIKLFNKNKSDELLGFLDSGNFLIDSLTNKPITIVDYNSLKNLLSNISITDILLNRTEKLNSEFNNVHMQNVSSINKGNKVIALEIEKLVIYLENENNIIINNAIIGLTIKSFINDLGYNALLNPSLF